MGCTASKLDKDDTVRRCKERRRLMSAAVSSRHHLSAAHSDYCRSLRLTGSALAAFSSGKPFAVSGNSTAADAKSPTPTSTHQSVYPPSPATQPPRPRKTMKLPHILSSSSSFSSSPNNLNFASDNIRANSTTYSTTPTQSSVWNWDTFYPPPSPPTSEYFDKLKNNNNGGAKIFTVGTDQENSGREDGSSDDGHSDDNDDKDSIFTKNSTFAGNDNGFFKHRDYVESYFDDKASSVINSHRRGAEKFDDRRSNYSFNAHHSDEEHARSEKEEVQCSEWGDHDHCSTTTSDSTDEDLASKSDFKTRASLKSTRNATPNSNVSRKSDVFSAQEKGGDNDEDDDSINKDKMIVVRQSSFTEIANVLKEHFDKASSSGDQVSEMLEAGRAQLDRSFKQLKKTIYHSRGILSNLSSTWTSKPPLAVKYRFEPGLTEERRTGPKSLCSTLDRLLAWEKKLYQEVKAREGVKIEHEKKLSMLQSQEYRGEEEAKIVRTKAAIKSLQSLISVTSQAVSTTSSSIIGLRDSDLVPQLVELCHGFMYTWRTMHRAHESQNIVVQQVRGLTNHTSGQTGPTSDHHRRATADLEAALSYWHSSFCRVIKHHRDFIHSLQGWFKLTLLPISQENPNKIDTVDKPPFDRMAEIFAFFDEWKLALDRVPDTVAYESIVSLTNIIRSISNKQAEEFKAEKRAEKAGRVVEKKASYIKKVEKVYYHSSMVGLVEEREEGDDKGRVLDSRDPLADKKAELAIYKRRADDEVAKYSKAVEVTRAATLCNMQTGLPGVFQAMTSFSSLMSEALENACTKSYAI